MLGEETNKEELSEIVESIICGICIFAVGENGELIPFYLNEGLYRMLGYSHKELNKMIKNLRRVIIPDDMPVFDQGISDILKDDGSAEFEFRTVTGDGGIRWLQCRGNLYGKKDGYPLIAGVILDVTERKSIEEELAIQSERLNILSQSVKEHFLDYNARTDVMNVRINAGAYSRGEIVIKDFMTNHNLTTIPEEYQQFIFETTNAAIHSVMSDAVEFKSSFFEEGDELHWYRATITSVRGADGYVSRVVGRVVNIDEEKQREYELQIRADVDSLTGLYNKGAATTLIDSAVKKCSENGVKAALLMIDLDHFKSVNDTLGHAVGDTVIQETGKLLNENFKGRDIVGRMGGDEFMIFMCDIKGVQDAKTIATNLNTKLRRTYGDSVSSVSISCSIGITMCGDSVADDFASVYQRADAALYATKEKGRDGYTIFEEM